MATEEGFQSISHAQRNKNDAEILDDDPLNDLRNIDVRGWCEGLDTHLFGLGGYEAFAAKATCDFARDVAHYRLTTPQPSKSTSRSGHSVSKDTRPPATLSPRKPKNVNGVTLTTLSLDNEKSNSPKVTDVSPKDFRPRVVKSRIQVDTNRATESPLVASATPDESLAPNSPPSLLFSMPFLAHSPARQALNTRLNRNPRLMVLYNF
ncbi:unnamed protein product [Rhizoctonia solani]|uniref:Uncharacterized protein n=1 Tax=Rhizoctonia solani TaxID=456999 RepID=A0A8H3GZ65_9AGAM|nr:unnamed protein product [Rhizoctonia solani]